MSEKIYESVGNYTKFKLIEMLIEKHQNRFKDFKNMEILAEDILKILVICGLKFQNELNSQFDEGEIK